MQANYYYLFHQLVCRQCQRIYNPQSYDGVRCASCNGELTVVDYLRVEEKKERSEIGKT